MSTYLNEHKVCEVFKAAVFVDGYVLTHKAAFVDRPFSNVNKRFENLNGNGKDTARGLGGMSEGGRTSLRA